MMCAASTISQIRKLDSQMSNLKKAACSATGVADLNHFSYDCQEPGLKSALLARTFHACSKEGLRYIVVVWDRIFVLAVVFDEVS